MAVLILQKQLRLLITAAHYPLHILSTTATYIQSPLGTDNHGKLSWTLRHGMQIMVGVILYDYLQKPADQYGMNY